MTTVATTMVCVQTVHVSVNHRTWESVVKVQHVIQNVVKTASVKMADANVKKHGGATHVIERSVFTANGIKSETCVGVV